MGGGERGVGRKSPGARQARQGAGWGEREAGGRVAVALGKAKGEGVACVFRIIRRSV